MGNFVGRGPRILIGRYVPDAFAARLDGVHLHRREFGENLGGVLQLDPIVLNILAGSKMAIAAVICAGDMAKLPHLAAAERSEEHTSELQSLMRTSYAVFCLKTKITKQHI